MTTLREALEEAYKAGFWAGHVDHGGDPCWCSPAVEEWGRIPEVLAELAASPQPAAWESIETVMLEALPCRPCQEWHDPAAPYCGGQEPYINDAHDRQCPAFHRSAVLSALRSVELASAAEAARLRLTLESMAELCEKRIEQDGCDARILARSVRDILREELAAFEPPKEEP